MLQISHTENPMCSATIDQIRLRRAVTLPLVSQKVGSSGFQSEIQVGSFELIENFLVQEEPEGKSDRRPKARQRTPGEARLSGRNSDEWLFGGRHRWRQQQIFKLCAK